MKLHVLYAKRAKAAKRKFHSKHFAPVAPVA